MDIKLYAFSVQITKAGTRGEPFDMNLIGWFADYPDPYDFINILLYGKTIAKTNNVNTAYFNDPVFNRRMERAALTTGDARAATYAALDRDLTKAAPFVVYGNSTYREFVSERIGCPVSSGGRRAQPDDALPEEVEATEESRSGCSSPSAIASSAVSDWPRLECSSKSGRERSGSSTSVT